MEKKQKYIFKNMVNSIHIFLVSFVASYSRFVFGFVRFVACLLSK